MEIFLAPIILAMALFSYPNSKNIWLLMYNHSSVVHLFKKDLWLSICVQTFASSWNKQKQYASQMFLRCFVGGQRELEGWDN